MKSIIGCLMGAFMDPIIGSVSRRGIRTTIAVFCQQVIWFSSHPRPEMNAHKSTYLKHTSCQEGAMATFKQELYFRFCLYFNIKIMALFGWLNLTSFFQNLF